MPILRDSDIDIISTNPEQTRRLGVRLGTLLRPGDVVCLNGELGAGKTALASGIGQGWGAREAVTSPTYNLVHQHTREADARVLYHLDCYRLESIEEIETIGWDDIFAGDAVVIVEWADKVEEALPEDRLWITVRILEGTHRNVVFAPKGDRYDDLLRQFRGIK